MSPARAIQAGNYSVLISNVAGSLLSTTAVFNVLPAAGAPVISMQPENRTVPAGYGVSFNVGATGTQPLAYQWYQDNNTLPAATNASLVFEAAQTTNAGAYTVLISNSIGATLSLPALLTVTNATGRGWLGYTNSTPICDADGITRLSGPAYLAQPYAGPSPSLLRPIGAPTPMSTGAWAGFFVTYVLSLPDIPTNGAVYLQLRAWEAAWGPCYEAARAAGGKFGFSEIKLATAKPVPSVRVPGFNLRAGLPFFFTGRLAIGDTLPDGTPQMILEGQSGFRYLIEKQSPPNNWLSFLVVTNTTGTVVFPRAEPASDTVEFYRSRILD